jgi:hypothetical protein
VAFILILCSSDRAYYAAWRVLQGFLDPDRPGNKWHGLSAASGTSERDVATEAFRWPLGDWLVVLAGLGLIGFAVQQVYAAITCRLERNLDVEEMVPRSVGSWNDGVVIPYPRCTTRRAGRLASRHGRSRIRRLRLLRDHPRPLSPHPACRLTAGLS